MHPCARSFLGHQVRRINTFTGDCGLVQLMPESVSRVSSVLTVTCARPYSSQATVHIGWGPTASPKRLLTMLHTMVGIRERWC